MARFRMPMLLAWGLGKGLAESEAAGSWKLHAGNLEVTLHMESSVLNWGDVRWSSKPRGTEQVDISDRELHPDSLFEVTLRKAPEQSGGWFSSPAGGHATVPSSACRIESPPDVTATSLSAELMCPARLRVNWSIELAEVNDAGSAGAVARIQATLTGPLEAAPKSLSMLLLPHTGEPFLEPTGLVNGSPVLVNNRFFLAIEHPLAVHTLNSTLLPPERSFIAELQHLGSMAWTGQSSFSYGAVIGAYEEKSQARRMFNEYLSAARPERSWKGPLVHYNSWYDFTSWQDHGFFNPKMGKNPQEVTALTELLEELSQDQMNESSALAVINAFRNELVDKRGVQIDSFLWDDGWDDPSKGMWAFNASRFPDGFKKLATSARAANCSNGIWLSPWGGYGTAKDTRVQEAKRQGLETNANGLSLAGPKYRAKFNAAAMSFRREAGVNFFKFDGIAGDPAEVPGEIEAMLAFSGELRAATPEGKEEKRSKKEKDVWINLTTGTWPSPFFLLWVDSIWRGHRDVLQMNVKDFPGASSPLSSSSVPTFSLSLA
eukprot:TRINITY_DN19134_c0_g1_i1.p1 TRINITY_DN19134_c0_g1~~TRINITY_DN19134_c0_g1_i1.p1  ORF type:complete len:546 (-),score=94.47 TRINITY_DN19134_c0_g1_i1:41-1678(-)